MRTLCLFLFITFPLIIGCASKKNALRLHMLHEKPLPEVVLGEYMDKLDIYDVKNSSKDFEIRKWYPFYYSDSFPVSLERFYLEKGVLKGEYYFFSNKAGTLILSKDDLKDMRVEKYTFPNIPKRFYDSLFYNYNFSKIDSIGIQIIKNAKRIPSTINYKSIFFEQVSGFDYYGIFITDPSQLLGVHEGLDQYASFARFTYDSICLSDSGFRKWSFPKINRIYGIERPESP